MIDIFTQGSGQENGPNLSPDNPDPIGPNHIDKVKFYGRKRGNISGKVQSLDLAGII